jgi:hypothetical protein
MSDVFGIGGAAQAVGSVASAALQTAAQRYATDKATAAADKAQNLLQQRYDTTRGDLLPYNATGQRAAAAIDAGQFQFGIADMKDVDQARGYFNQAATLGSGPGAQAALAATPGYQFALNQGLQATQNSAAARGLGVSGAALKGAATYATGLADQTYTNQFNKLINLGQNALTTNASREGNITNTFNRLASTEQIGENAAASTGTSGASLGNAAANATLAGGAAQVAGAIGTGNALADGIGGVTNAYTGNQARLAYQQQQNQQTNGVDYKGISDSSYAI